MYIRTYIQASIRIFPISHPLLSKPPLLNVKNVDAIKTSWVYLPTYAERSEYEVAGGGGIGYESEGESEGVYLEKWVVGGGRGRL